MKRTPFSDPRSATTKNVELSFHIPDSDCLDAQDGEDVATKRNWGEYLPVISLTACVIAVLMDPLFFFIPFINENSICIGIDEAVKITALISRALTDISFLVHIIYQIRQAVEASNSKCSLIDGNSKSFGWRARAIAKELPYRYFITDIFAILPVPQVVIIYLFDNNQTKITLSTMILNFMLLIQYLPRMYRIFLSSRNLRKNSELWLKGSFYFFMYILASYVLGAFYYFNTIQRQVMCWQVASVDVFAYNYIVDPFGAEHAGKKHCAAVFGKENCTKLYHYTCHGLDRETLIKERLQKSCLMDGYFQFGIFGASQESPVEGTKYENLTRLSNQLKKMPLGDNYFFDKLLYFIWWGLRNVSNFGTNLTTSPSAWESCFGVIICTIGLILFAFLIGNMQECMQSAEKKKTVRDKVEAVLDKRRDLSNWMDANYLSKKLRKEIIAHIKQNLENDKDTDLENLFALIPWNNVKSLKPTICMSMLNKVPGFQNMDARGRKMICHYLKPVIYSEKTILFGVEEPLDSILFVVDGIVLIYSTSGDTTHQDDAGKEITVRSLPMIHGSLEKGDVYGDEQLLSWASSTDVPISYATLPISTKIVRCHTKVEGFVLIANDLKAVVSLYKLKPNHSSSGNENERSTYVSGSMAGDIGR